MNLSDQEVCDLIDALNEAKLAALDRDHISTYNHYCHLYNKVIAYRDGKRRRKHE